MLSITFQIFIPIIIVIMTSMFILIAWPRPVIYSPTSISGSFTLNSNKFSLILLVVFYYSKANEVSNYETELMQGFHVIGAFRANFDRS